MNLRARFRSFVGKLLSPRSPSGEGPTDLWDDGRTFDLSHDGPTQVQREGVQAQFDAIAAKLNILIPAENRFGDRSFRSVVTADRMFDGEALIEIHVGLWNDAEFAAAQYCFAPERSGMLFSRNIDPQTKLSHADVSQRMFDYFIMLDDRDEGGNSRYVAVLPRRDTDPEKMTIEDALISARANHREWINLQGHNQDDIVYRGLYDVFDIAEISDYKIKSPSELKAALDATPLGASFGARQAASASGSAPKSVRTPG